MKITLFFAIIVFVLTSGWLIQRQNEIKKAEWLIGIWENKTSRGSIYESWTKINEGELSGKSFIVQESDTVTFETIKLVQEQQKLYYIPTVKNQNGGLPVRFEIKNISDSEMVFENQQHDFPQIIIYRKINADSLLAQISGTKNGKERIQQFPMKRVK